MIAPGPSREDALSAIATVLRHLGADPSSEAMRETPRRVVDALAEMTSGRGADVGAVLGTAFEEGEYADPVTQAGVAFTSLCEHHLLPFSGTAAISYVPDGRVVGISKLARVVEIFARRFQLQERLTRQVAQALQEHLKPRGVGVAIVATHACMSCRGVRQPRAELYTTFFLGTLRTDAARAELLHLLRK